MYYNPNLKYEDLIKRLKSLDMDVYLALIKDGKKRQRIECFIAGSSSLILNKINILATIDIDVLELNVSTRTASKFLEKYDMNTRISALMDSIPYNWQDRAIKLEINTKIMDYWLLSVEDAIICKIVAYREKDKDHLKAENLLENIDWNLLHDIACEMKLNMLSDNNYKWFISRFNDFAKEKGHEEIIVNDVL